jgi:hypothetical protein
LIVSPWVNGNFKAWKHKRTEQRRRHENGQEGYQKRFVLPALAIEAEFHQAGFEIRQRLNFLPLSAMRRVYVLSQNGA